MSGIIEIDKVKTYLLALQDKLSDEIEELDADQRFAEDAWERPQGGGGISRVLERGAVFEKAGVISPMFTASGCLQAPASTA